MVTVKMRQVDIACDELSAQNRWGIVGPNAGKPGKALRTWRFANLPQFGLEQRHRHQALLEMVTLDSKHLEKK